MAEPRRISDSSSCGSGLEIQALPLMDGCRLGTPLPSGMWQVAQVLLKRASPFGAATTSTGFAAGAGVLGVGVAGATVADAAAGLTGAGAGCAAIAGGGSCLEHAASERTRKARGVRRLIRKVRP